MHKFSAGLITAACLVSAAAMAEDAQTKSAALRTTCQTCHGEYGNSVTRETPRLNGQRAEYLAMRLNNMRNPLRESPRAIRAMGTETHRLNKDVIVALANYYASQTPTERHPGALAKQGEKIYRDGAGACQSCHGPQGEGLGRAPRLAGQHRAYLVIQLHAFGMTARVSDIATHQGQSLTEDQVQAVSSYLAGD